MKKLVINGLLCVAIIVIILAVIAGLSKLRVVDATDQEVDVLMQNTDTTVAEKKATQEQKEVTVTVQEEKTSDVQETINDDEVNAFLNDLE